MQPQRQQQQHYRQQQQQPHYRRPEEDNRHAVSSHYNERRQQTKSERQESPIYALRCVNNWIKAVLIEDHVARNSCVLDLCGGRGGDLDKWAAQSAAHVTLVDIAEEEVERARERWLNNNNRDRVPSARFRCADAFAIDAAQERWVVPAGYNAVACQFALHYAFESETKLRALLHNVATSLAKNGVFICSFTDGERVTATCFDYQTQQEREFDNGVCRIRFDYGRPAYIYGTRYHFTLGDAINDCPEYCVHLPTLVEEARAVGLHLVRTQTFDELCHNAIDRCPNHAEKWKRMVNTEIPIEQWHAIGLYRACVFVRDDRPLAAQQQQQQQQPTVTTETASQTPLQPSNSVGIQNESPSKYDYQPFANNKNAQKSEEEKEEENQKKRSVVSYVDAWHDHKRCEGEPFVLSGPALDGSGTGDSQTMPEPRFETTAPTILRLKHSASPTSVVKTKDAKTAGPATAKAKDVKPKSALKKKASDTADATTAGSEQREPAKKKARIAVTTKTPDSTLKKGSEAEKKDEASITLAEPTKVATTGTGTATAKANDTASVPKKATAKEKDVLVVPVSAATADAAKKAITKEKATEKKEEVPQSFSRKPVNAAVMRDGRLLEKAERVKTGDKFAIGNHVYVKQDTDGWVLQP